MSTSSGRPVGDEGVSEVLSFILGFFMAFMILLTTLYAFGQVNSSARELSAEAQARDVANRVALGVQEAFAVASARNDTQASIVSSAIRYNRTIDVPERLQGWRYNMTLDANFVNVTVRADRAIQTTVPTFNAAVELPAPGSCPASIILCRITGSTEPLGSRFVVSYAFNETSSPRINEITLTT